MVKSTEMRVRVAAAAFSALVTLLVFIGVRDNQFVALDDYAYIVNNRHIEALNLQTVVWALSSFHEGNWHPVTMLSLALDRSLWGLEPFGYLLTNLLIHSSCVFTACLLFSLLLSRIFSAAPGPETPRDNRAYRVPIIIGSIAAALFFGMHPLRVESVVWASERKDVLCLFFMTLALYGYIRFALRCDASPERGAWRFRSYRVVVLLGTLAVMSKPAAVSLPLILCIVDWYPLGRLRERADLFRIAAEKIPFVILALLCGVLTLFSQKVAMNMAPDVDLLSRLLVACKALVFYLAATVWPSGLAVFYMHPGNVATSNPGLYAIYALLIAAISLTVILVGRRHRFWTAIWLYYLVTVAPMLGLIQVGGQWAADRYSYLPSLGLALVWGGGVVWLLERLSRSKRNVWVYAGLVLAACQLMTYGALTIRQIPVWRSTETLASRVITLMPHQSGAVYLARAIYRNEHGDYEGALADIGETMSIALRRGLREPLPSIAFEQALILKNLGRYSEALAILDWGISLSSPAAPADAAALKQELLRLDAAATASLPARQGVR